MKGAMNVIRKSIHVMDSFDPSLYENTAPPLVSIYLPVEYDSRERKRDEKTGDTFKELIKAAQSALAKEYSDERFYSGIMYRLNYLLTHPDMPLWVNAHKGLGILANNDNVFVYDLDFDVELKVVVGNEYYLNPLLHNYEHPLSYCLLALNSDRFVWLEGNKDSLHYIKLPSDIKNYYSEIFAAPQSKSGKMDELGALDYKTLDNHESEYENYKSRDDVAQENALKFFRYVNDVVTKTLARDDATPIILVASPEHEALFRKVSTIKNLMPKSISKNPDGLKTEDVLADAKAILDEKRDSEIQTICNRYQLDASKGRASSDVSDIGMAVLERKVDTVLVRRGASVAGTYDIGTGKITRDKATAAKSDIVFDTSTTDIIDELVQAALKQGAVVHVLNADQMPTDRCISAIYRY